MADTTLHEDLVRALAAQYPDVRRTGFMRELATVGDYMRDLLQHDREWRSSVAIVPDAFVIDRVGKHVVLFEVVHTHYVSDEKKAKVEEIGWALDQDGYDIAIIRVDQHGRSLIDPVGDALTQTIAQSGVGG